MSQAHWSRSEFQDFCPESVCPKAGPRKDTKRRGKKVFGFCFVLSNFFMRAATMWTEDEQ